MRSSYQSKSEASKPDTLHNILEEMNKHAGLTFEGLLGKLSKVETTYEHWQAYLKMFSDETLYVLLLRVDIAKIVESTCYEPAKLDVKNSILEAAIHKLDDLLKGDILVPALDRAYFFCLLEVYDRIRAQEPEYKSSIAYVGSWFMEGSSQSEKQGFCKLYKQFLCSGHKFNKFDDFLDEVGLLHKKRTILEKGSRFQLIHTLVKNRGNDLEAALKANDERLASLQAG